MSVEVRGMHERIITRYNDVEGEEALVKALIGLVLIVASALEENDVVKRGAPIGDSPVVAVGDVLADFDRFESQTVIVEGEVGDVCQMKGCWMALAPEGVATKIRVTFQNYGFFVPKDARGCSARMEGTFQKSVLSKDEADHLEGEGATLERNPDGTANELSFVASGVELRRKNASR
jgi:hypothetical protein